MAFTAAVDRDRGIVEIVLRDRVKVDDVVDAMRSFADLPDFRSDMGRLYVFDPLADLSDLSIETLRELYWATGEEDLEFCREAGPVSYKVAMLAEAPVHAPVARLYQAIRPDNAARHAELKVFVSRDEATGWLLEDVPRR